MIDDPVIRDDWYVVARSSDLAEGGVMEARLLGETLVLWRTGGEVAAPGRILCIHRGVQAVARLGEGRADRLPLSRLALRPRPAPAR